MNNETLSSLNDAYESANLSYFEIKNSKFVHNDTGYLKCDLYCKFIFDEKLEYDHNKNFVLRVNFFKTVKIPLSFYMSQFWNESTAGSNLKSKKEILLNKLKNKNFTKVLKKSDQTNHQEVFYHEYTIKTYDDLKFFNDLNVMFDCCVDFNFEKDFEVFLIQQGINFGLETRTLARILACSKFYSFKFKNEFKRNFKLFRLDYLFEYPSKNTFEEFCISFWELTKKTSLKKIKTTHCIGTFDIEVGLTDDTLTDQLPFPSPLTGYVQCIVLHTIDFKTVYIENTSKITLWCINKFQSKNLKAKLFESFKKYNIHAKDLKIKIFNSELELINSFFVFTLYLDYLIGYNSKAFDLYFLILRANILSNTTNWYRSKYISSYVLSPFYTNCPIMFKCEKNVLTHIKCPKCSKKIMFSADGDLLKNLSKELVVYCLCQNRCVVEGSLVNFEQKSSYFPIQELPFAFHRDLMFQETIFENTSNKKLETASNYHFRQEISEIKYGNTENIIVSLKRKFKKNEIFLLANTMIIGVKLVTFTIEKNSNQIMNEKLFKLIDIRFLNTESLQLIDYNRKNFNFNFNANFIQEESVFIQLECKCEENLSEYLKETEKNTFFVSVGKTSNQTLEDQLLLKNDENLIDTCTYCTFDVILTFALEYVHKTLFDIQNIEFYLQCPFNVLSWTPARKASYLVNMKIYKSSLLIVLTNFKIAHILKESLEIEGIPDNEWKNSLNYPIFKIKSLQNLNEHLNLDTNTINTNEFELGITSESDPGDFISSKNILDRILSLAK